MVEATFGVGQLKAIQMLQRLQEPCLDCAAFAYKRYRYTAQAADAWWPTIIGTDSPCGGAAGQRNSLSLISDPYGWGRPEGGVGYATGAEGVSRQIWLARTWRLLYLLRYRQGNAVSISCGGNDSPRTAS
jgi:hypothetical protein